MRIFRTLLPALLVAGLATQAPAQAAAQAAAQPPSGWSLDGDRLVWRASGPVPVGDAAVEFWSGGRVLGRPVPSADHRTFVLDHPVITDPGDLSVRAGARRLDVVEPPRPARVPVMPERAPLPEGAVDPGTAGPFGTTTGEYVLESIDVPGYPVPIEMRAVVVAPVGASGKRPFALFLHGRHDTCYDPAVEFGLSVEWPCPAGTKEVPSYRGYLQAQRLLASQGYVTVSVSANGVNAQDGWLDDSGAQGRSAVVRRHLARWADWAGTGRGAAPEIVRTAPVPDLSNVLLVGHSRGGDGVNRAAADSLSPPPGGSGHDGPVRWTVRGTVLIGPTIFGQNPAPDVPSLTILPGCDGDVSDLQGQMYVDATRGVSRGAALHSAVYVVGANHNYFNTEWTPGQSEAPGYDDVWLPDTVCRPDSPIRLTAAQQQTAGATYIAAAARLFVARDRRVLPLVDGSGVRAPSADPARALSHAVGAARTPFVVPDAATTAGGGARVCRVVTADPATACLEPDAARWQAHFTTFSGISEDPDRFAVALAGPGVVRPAKPVSLAGSHSLALRIIVPPNTTGNRFDVAVTDAGGRRAVLGSVSVDGLATGGLTSAYWAQEVRVPLPRTGIDLAHVAALELSGPGEAWVVDAHGWRDGLPDPRPVALPRVDVDSLTVEEGDSGTRSYEVRVSSTGETTGTVRLFIGDEQGVFTTRLVTVRPGHHTIAIPFEVTGNTRWSTGSQRWVYAKAIRGVATPDWVGGLDVTNDDPRPTVTITPTAGPVAEGAALTWTATSSAVADSPIFWYAYPLPPETGPELSTTDVDPDWFREHSFGSDPEPSRPMSEMPLLLTLSVDPGSLVGTLTVPTIADGEAEPAEYLRLFLASWPPQGDDREITGTVTG